VEAGAIDGLVARLGASTEALAALGALLRLRVSGQEAPSEVQASLAEVAAALGIDEELDRADPRELAAHLAPIRALLLEAVDLVSDPTRAPGWTVTDVELLESLGRSSAAVAEELAAVAAAHEELADALRRPGAAFLDVGVGVGAIAIEMCRQWPELRAVGIDPFDTALALARRNVAQAELEPRIELRRQGVEELADVEAYDLAWLPGPFLSRRALDAGLGSVLRALRPGGYAVLGIYYGRDPLDAALAHLRTARAGGAILGLDEAASLLAAAGFEHVETSPARGEEPAVNVAGRRPR
jgi:SAM-dependent methyltransferase